MNESDDLSRRSYVDVRRTICGGYTPHQSRNKKVRSEGKIKAQLLLSLSLCLHIVFQDLSKRFGSYLAVIRCFC
jgi:hypothetical protein